MSRRPTLTVLSVVLIAAVVVGSIIVLPILGDDGPVAAADAGTDEIGDGSSPKGPTQAALETVVAQQDDRQTEWSEFDPVTFESPTAADQSANERGTTQGDPADALEAGVEEGIELVQSQGLNVTQDQRAAALEGARASVSQYQNADSEQVRAATAGAVHGALIQKQSANVTQIQHAVAGATGGGLSQSQSVNATQLQSAAWGGAHGAIAQSQNVSVEQIQVASSGAAAGAANEAGAKDVGSVAKIQEAAQGSAYGALTQYQSISVEQRQRVTIEHVRHAAAGAAAGALEGSTSAGLEQMQRSDVRQEQQIDVEQRQRVTIKQIQKAAAGAAKGALVQEQTVSVEQTQAAARGASRGSLTQIQGVRIEQVQRISITQVQEASVGAATGAISQSQDATVEQIQAAATGSAGGVLVQRQEISITQRQYAAIGAAEGAISSAFQRQSVTVEQIQAAAFGAGDGSVSQAQVVQITQVQHLARGAASGALSQTQAATVTQIQAVARVTAQETAHVVQSQRISITQLQTLTEETASETIAYVVQEDTEDVTEITQQVEVTVVQRLETIDRIEGTASIDVPDQQSDGERITVEDVSLSEGGYVAVYDGVAVDADPADIVGVSRYLEDGSYENVTIELDDSLASSGAIVAVAHHETTGDETFQYVDSDGEEDVPYVTGAGAPVLDGAFLTVADDTRDATATLSVSDQTGNGSALTVDEANASVPYTVAATVDGESIGSESFSAGELVTNLSLGLEPALEENATVDVSIVGEDGATLVNETITYSVVEDGPEGSISVDDQTGDGETLEVDAASASVPYVISAAYGDERVDSDQFEANTTITDEELELDPPLEENATVDVSVRAVADDAVLANESVEYGIVQRGSDRPTANLTVADQTGDGETLTVTQANASVEYALTVTDENGTQRTTSDTFNANATIGPEEFPLDPPLEENSTLEVAVVDVENDTILETDTVEYTVDGALEEFAVEFASCSRAEVTASLEAGDQVAASTGFYTTGGFGNTILDDLITVGEDVPAPFNGTIVFEIGDERSVTTEGDRVTVEVPDYGTFGTYISGISSPQAAPFGGIDFPNPSETCRDEVRPDRPSLSVVETMPVGDGNAIDVTFGYENPNDAPVAANSAFVEGTTADRPPSELESGQQTFTVEWAPESDSERLVWQVDLSNFGYDEPLTAETPPAGEIEPSQPAAFDVSITGTNSPVEQGDPIAVDAELENVGDEAGSQNVSIAVDGTIGNATSVSLEPGETRTVTLRDGTTDLEPGEYPVEVSTANETAETTVTVEPAGEPAAFAIADVSAPETGLPGEQVTVNATIENRGDLEGTQTVTYSIDGQLAAEESVTLAGGQATTLSFSTDLPPGTSTHTIATDDDQTSVTIETTVPVSNEETEPEAPTEPEQPDEPTEPEQPDTPAEPEQPDEPTEPEQPDTPAEPEQPDEPTEPEQPDTPAEPEQPETPADDDGAAGEEETAVDGNATADTENDTAGAG
ncbi:DUF7282 domain-containing protein [Natrinema halophilum]|uniref:DUF7282 domain-containing protein n=1 Tax=Natrinema halophilum TaxID=1699371 RepID=UPI001C534148|nr:CARDB domain-containing protein [Natrinema halophilum]UHQ96066.1 hypothetical protein HYG82_21020 [Natrinema halophilum]